LKGSVIFFYLKTVQYVSDILHACILGHNSARIMTRGVNFCLQFTPLQLYITFPLGKICLTILNWYQKNPSLSKVPSIYEVSAKPKFRRTQEAVYAVLVDRFAVIFYP